MVNSGNSNAFTGKAGEAFVDATVKRRLSWRVRRARCSSPRPSSGSRSRPTPSRRTCRVPMFDETAFIAGGQGDHDHRYPEGVYPDGFDRWVQVTINGLRWAGSGMIAPDMATMLAFVFTDAAIPAPVLQALVSAANEKSFNCITVDGDTPPAIRCWFAPRARAGNPLVSDAGDAQLADFKAQLEAVLVDLAQQIVRDGEGASKFVTVRVEGADTDQAAKRIALSIANSPLVKTAVAGEDANWGRIVMAVGKAGEKADRDKLRISAGGVLIAADGMEVPGYDETPVAEHMKGQYIDFLVELGIGSGSATVWTCDLTHGLLTSTAVTGADMTGWGGRHDGYSDPA